MGALGVVGISLIGWLDWAISVEISTSIFYVAPVAFVAWYAGGVAGVLTAVLAAAVWLLTDRLWVSPYSHPAILFWNGLVRLALFSIIAVLLARLHGQLRAERRLARCDGLTGVFNARAFSERLQEELHRLRRFGRVFSLAYIDLDNFKLVNDRRGHGEGDAVLLAVAETLRGSVRDVDTVARIGGDEFAVLFVEAEAGPSAAALENVRRALGLAMRQGGWPITFSVGMVTYAAAPELDSEAVALADELMYEVKRGSKNASLHRVWDGKALTAPRGTLDEVVV